MPVWLVRVIYASMYLRQTVRLDHVEAGTASGGESLGYREYLEDLASSGGKAGYEHASVLHHICSGVEAATWHHGS